MANKIEFNLLPDTKMETVKQNRARNAVVSIAILAAGASLALFILLFFTADILQKKQLNDANKQIQSANTQLKNVNNIAKILTVQNQLTTLAKLHQSKHITSRIYTYLPQGSPTKVSICVLTLDTTANSL